MDYRDHHVVVTGGTGALGSAVIAALLEQGAICHVPTIDKREVERFPHRSHDRVRLVEISTLADEGEVARFHATVPHLWASIHIAGGFAMAPLAETTKAALMAGVAALTEALAQEVAADGILVNAVAPSILDTPANRQAMPKADHALWPKVEEVAATILFLASPENKVTRGAIVPVYGRS